jgi:hypothetical protein
MGHIEYIGVDDIMITKRILKTEWIVLEQICSRIGNRDYLGSCYARKMQEFSFLAEEI